MKDIAKFKTWLIEHGAIIIPPTNEWEVIRFTTINGTSVVYTKKTGQLTFTGESDAAYTAFRANKGWRAVNTKRQNMKRQKAGLAARDGKRCFFHGEYMPMDKLTAEHLLNKSHGGTDHLSNLCLACEPCNQAVGNWPLVKKMLWRDEKLKQAQPVMREELEIVKATARKVWYTFDTRYKSLNMRNLLTPKAPKIELRNIIQEMIGEKI